MVSYLTRLAKAAVVFAALAGGNSVLAQEEELTREEVIERISRVEAAIEEHRAKGEDEHVAGATGVLEQLQAALRDFDAQGGAAGGGGGRAGGPPQGGEEEEDVFSILDQDQDGRISRDEFAQGFEQEPEGLWDNEDANGDGFISFEEFGALGKVLRGALGLDLSTPCCTCSRGVGDSNVLPSLWQADPRVGNPRATQAALVELARMVRRMCAAFCACEMKIACREWRLCARCVAFTACILRPRLWFPCRRSRSLRGLLHDGHERRQSDLQRGIRDSLREPGSGAQPRAVQARRHKF